MSHSSSPEVIDSRRTGSTEDGNHLPKRRRLLPGSNSTQEQGLMRDGAQRGVHRFVGSGSGIHFIRTVYDLLARRSGGDPVQSASSPHINLVPGEDDQLAAGQNVNVHSPVQDGVESSFWHHNELSAYPHINSASFNDLVLWTKSYFENWHPASPFLNAPSVLEMFEDISRDGIDAVRSSDSVIVRSIISISLADARQSSVVLPPVPPKLVFLNNSELVTSIQFALALPASLGNLQAAICLQLFLVSMLKFNFASRLGGLIVRMALHLGLHRCPSRFQNFSPEEAQMRRRVFWSLYCLERMLSQSLGLPLDLRDDDVDVCYPGDELHTPGPGRSPAREERNVHQLQLLTMLSKHARIRGLILELRNKSVSSRHDTLERSTRVQAELAKWANEVDETIEDDSQMPISESHKLILRVLQHESTVALNRPLATARTENPASSSALQNCISASRSIISLLDSFRAQERTHDPNSLCTLHSPMVWPLFTWSIWMSCFVLTYAALEGHCILSSAQRYAHKTLNVLEHFSLRQTAWPNSCADAVRQLLLALTSKAEDLRKRVAPEAGSWKLPNERLAVTDATGSGEGGFRGSQFRSPVTQNRTTRNQPSHNNTAGSEQGSRRAIRLADQSLAPLANDSPTYHAPPGSNSGSASHHIRIPTPQAYLQASPQYSNSWPDLYSDDFFDPLGAIDFSNFAPGTTDPSRIPDFL